MFNYHIENILYENLSWNKSAIETTPIWSGNVDYRFESTEDIRLIDSDLSNDIDKMIKFIKQPAEEALISDYKKINEEEKNSSFSYERLTIILNYSVRLEINGQIDKALDLVFENIDNYLKNNKFNTINNKLKEIDVKNYTPNVLLTLVTATIPAQNKLPDWNKFVECVYQFFRTNNLLSVSLNNWFQTLINE